MKTTICKIEETSTGDKKQGVNGEYWGVGIKTHGTWYRGVMWNSDSLRWFQSLQPGDKVPLILEIDTTYGDQFKVQETTMLHYKIDRLQDTINNLIRLNNLKWKDD